MRLLSLLVAFREEIFLLKSPQRKIWREFLYFWMISWSCAKLSLNSSTLSSRLLHGMYMEMINIGCWDCSSIHLILFPPTGTLLTKWSIVFFQRMSLPPKPLGICRSKIRFQVSFALPTPVNISHTSSRLAY